MYSQCGSFIKSDLLQLWTESFGSNSNTPILLIFGSGGQGIMWPDEFCHKLVKAGFFVIRYDHRDTGLSSIVNYDTHPYNLDDLTKDAVAILDAYNIRKAHIVGASMGGFIGQLLAIDYSEKVLSLTSIASSPYKAILPNESGEFTDQSILPPPYEELLEFFVQESTQKPVTTKDDYIDKEIRIWRACNGQGEDCDESIMSTQAEKAFSRTSLTNVDATENHSKAIEASDDRTANLPKITAPTLVIHGDKDPLLPLEHGKAIANNIPNAKLVVIENMGHIFPFKHCDDIVNLIANHVITAEAHHHSKQILKPGL